MDARYADGFVVKSNGHQGHGLQYAEAVVKKDKRSFPLLGYMNADSIRLNNAMFKIEHLISSSLVRTRISAQRFITTGGAMNDVSKTR